jgi:hypothetical protein
VYKQTENDIIEEHYAGIQFMAGGKERRAKPDYKLKEGRGMFSKAWIFPDGKAAQLGEEWHHTFLNNNPEVTKKGTFIFRMCYLDDFQGASMARFAGVD